MVRANGVQEQLHRTLNSPDVDLQTAIRDEGGGVCRLQELDKLMTGGAAVGAEQAERSIMGIQC